MSAIGAASSIARAVGTTPLGVRRNSGSLSSRRSRPRPWLTADGERLQPLRRPADMPLVQDHLEQHQQVQVGAGEINLIQHIAEIISLDSARSNCDFASDATPTPTHALEKSTCHV